MSQVLLSGVLKSWAAAAVSFPQCARMQLSPEMLQLAKQSHPALGSIRAQTALESTQDSSLSKLMVHRMRLGCCVPGESQKHVL